MSVSKGSTSRIVTVNLPPWELALIKEILAAEENLAHVLEEPFAQGVINFDTTPLPLFYSHQPIASGTDLTANQPYDTVQYGVTFTALSAPGRGLTAVYAASLMNAPSPPNVCSLLTVTVAGSTGALPFGDDDGQVQAQFNPPVKSVSIDAIPQFQKPDSNLGQVLDVPYLRAYDAANGLLAEADYPYTVGDPAWGTSQTLTVNQPNLQDAAQIESVQFSAKPTPGLEQQVGGLFDNLFFQR